MELIELMFEKGNTCVGAPEYIPYLWIMVIPFFFVVLLVLTSILNLIIKLWSRQYLCVYVDVSM